MSQIAARQRLYRRNRQSLVHGFDPVLTAVVGLLLFIGTLLVWAATRDWYTRNGLDGQYYLKRHIINIMIGLVLATEQRLLITACCVRTRHFCGEQAY